MVRLDRQQGYVRATLQTQVSFVQALATIEGISRDSADWPDKRLLIDLRDTLTLKTFSDQFFIGVGVATHLKHLKIASLVPAHRITHTSEKAANQAGARLKVFAHEHEAVAWLTGDGGPGPT